MGSLYNFSYTIVVYITPVSILRVLRKRFFAYRYNGKEKETGLPVWTGGSVVTNGNQDHKALRDKDTNHKGYRQYKSMQKQLGKNDNKYEKEFKDAENHYNDE